MFDSTVPLPTSQYRGRLLDREGLTELIAMDAPTDSVESAIARRSPAPCGHVFCRYVGEDARYLDTEFWWANCGCSLQDSGVPAATPARRVPRLVGARHAYRAVVRSRSEAELTAVFTVWLLSVTALAVILVVSAWSISHP